MINGQGNLRAGATTMKVALYIGDHTKDTPGVRLGWWLTRMVQKGEFSNVTHVEAILAEHEDGSVTIGSATLRKEPPKNKSGVRTKKTHLTKGHWRIVDMPMWDVVEARQWFVDHDEEEYDDRGAFASCMPFSWAQFGKWFCNAAVGASGKQKSAKHFGPSLFAAMCFTFGTEVTDEFFSSRLK